MFDDMGAVGDKEYQEACAGPSYANIIAHVVDSMPSAPAATSSCEAFMKRRRRDSLLVEHGGSEATRHGKNKTTGTGRTGLGNPSRTGKGGGKASSQRPPSHVTPSMPDAAETGADDSKPRSGRKSTPLPQVVENYKKDFAEAGESSCYFGAKWRVCQKNLKYYMGLTSAAMESGKDDNKEELQFGLKELSVIERCMRLHASWSGKGSTCAGREGYSQAKSF